MKANRTKKKKHQKVTCENSVTFEQCQKSSKLDGTLLLGAFPLSTLHLLPNLIS